MQVVIFGLTVSSSWGNGHATLWRGLCSALARRGHRVIFFEKDVPYYAMNRDLTELPDGGELVLYSELDEIQARAARELDGADLALTTSYCADALTAGRLILDSRAQIKAFYDLDTPVTLDRLARGETVEYLPAAGLGDYDLVLSYTGGRALDSLRQRLGARRVAPLYGSVDPARHYPVPPVDEYRAELSYLGTYAADRQAGVDELFLQPARAMGEKKFVIGGSQYPPEFPWAPNIFFVRHMPPPLHPSFFCSSRATLNVTRRAMAEWGFCPSGRLFEAAACGVPVLSDTWAGLGDFFDLEEEIVPVRTAADTLAALAMSDEELGRLARRARARTLAEHTAEARIVELERVCEQTLAGGAALTA